MNFLKKIFSRGSKPAAKKETFVDRAPRIRIIPLHNIIFQLDTPIEISQVFLGNISSTGIGLIKGDRQDWPPPGTVISGRLVYRQVSISLKMRIVHSSSMLIGCAFLTELDRMYGLVRSYFNLEQLAIRLREVDRKFLKDVPNGTPHWFQSSEGCELYFVERERHIESFHLVFFGNYLDCERGRALRYGKIVANEQDADELAYRRSDIIRNEAEIPREVLESSLKFLANVGALTEEERAYISEKLSDALAN